jgi:hypothetical protein
MPRRKKGTTRVRRKTQKGRGVKSVLRKAHSVAKSTKLVSRVLRHRGHNIAADVAEQLGYGFRPNSIKLIGTRANMTGDGRRRKKGTLRVRHLTVPRLTTRRRRTRRVVIASAPAAGSRALFPAGRVGQRGRGFIGKTLGGFAGGLLGGLLPF